MATITVTFARTFTRGTLEGLTVQDRVSFATLEAARDWAQACEGKLTADGSRIHGARVL